MAALMALQAAAWVATAARVDAEAESWPEESPLWASPVAVDSLALSPVDSSVNGAAATLVLFLQDGGSL